MKVIHRFLLLMGGVLLPLLSLQVNAALSPQEIDQRYHSLSKELRCLVCQNESLAESPAGLAEDLRQEVRQQVESGKTDDEIKSYLVDRYGYFVLYKPPFIGRTLLLWTAPFLILFGLGGWVIVQLVRKEKKPLLTEPIHETRPDTDYAAQLEKIKKEFKQEHN